MGEGDDGAHDTTRVMATACFAFGENARMREQVFSEIIIFFYYALFMLRPMAGPTSSCSHHGPRLG